MPTQTEKTARHAHESKYLATSCVFVASLGAVYQPAPASVESKNAIVCFTMPGTELFPSFFNISSRVEPNSPCPFLTSEVLCEAVAGAEDRAEPGAVEEVEVTGVVRLATLPGDNARFTGTPDVVLLVKAP